MQRWLYLAAQLQTRCWFPWGYVDVLKKQCAWRQRCAARWKQQRRRGSWIKRHGQSDRTALTYTYLYTYFYITHIHIDSYSNIYKPYNWYTLATHLYWLSGLSQRPCASCFSRFRYCHNAFHCGRWYAFINTASTTQRFCLQAIRGKTSPLQLQ